MSIRRPFKSRGFTLVELLIVIILVIVISSAFYTFFRASLIGYLNLQEDASNLTTVAYESQRIANVVRGLTDITSASADDLVMYAYFSPADTYVSQVHYYLNSDQTVLYADVTRMTANPPEGVPIPDSKTTYTIISPFRQTTGLNLFDYLDANSEQLTFPITDPSTIKSIRINLGTSTSGTTNQAINVEVDLRNRKTNL